VWLHGLGADGHDFEPVIPLLRRPDLRVTLPHAPGRPVTINMGLVMPAWYDIRSLERGPNRESADDIETSARQIAAFLDQEIQRGVPSERLVLAGFSQGAAMALHVGLRYPEKLAGIISLSGYLVLEDRIAAEASASNCDTPIFMGHGSRDPVVPLQGGQAAHDLLAPGREVTWADYPMEHEVCPAEIEAVAKWLGTNLPA
jgi:phospholipase/carboxylesterase